MARAKASLCAGLCCPPLGEPFDTTWGLWQYVRFLLQSSSSCGKKTQITCDRERKKRIYIHATFLFNISVLCIDAIFLQLRMAIRYLERQTIGKPPNPLQKALFCMIKCFLRCLECCLDKINKYSLSWTAVYGDGFCISVCSSFALVWRNLFRVAAVNTVPPCVYQLLYSKNKDHILT